jgi:hypothetical protein
MFVLDTSLKRTARGTVIWPVPAQHLPALPETLDCRGLRLHCKTEFHLTVLAHGDARRLLGDSRDDALFARWRQAWRDIDHRVEYLDELWLLRTIDAAGTRDHALAVACHAPALAAGRKLLASWTGVELPEAPPHVTLYVEVDPRGIGVPDHATLRERRIAAGPWVLFGLPYVRNNAR